MNTNDPAGFWIRFGALVLDALIVGVPLRNMITKRGSRRLRTTLYLAVKCGLRSSRNQKLRAFYDKKRAEVLTSY